MSKQTWIKWVVGLAGVTSFSAFVGVLNQGKEYEQDSAVKPLLSPEFQSIQEEQATTDDPVQAEWLYYEKNKKEHHDHHEEDDEEDEEEEWHETQPYSQTEGTKRITRTRAS